MRRGLHVVGGGEGIPQKDPPGVQGTAMKCSRTRRGQVCFVFLERASVPEKDSPRAGVFSRFYKGIPRLTGSLPIHSGGQRGEDLLPKLLYLIKSFVFTGWECHTNISHWRYEKGTRGG